MLSMRSKELAYLKHWRKNHLYSISEVMQLLYWHQEVDWSQGELNGDFLWRGLHRGTL